MSTLNVQIVPWPTDAAKPPIEHRIVLLPARDGQAGEAGPCPTCAGTGKLPRGDQCRKCSGTGRGTWVRALRMDVYEDQYERVADWLDSLSLPPDTSVQCTVKLAECGGGMTNTGDAVIVCGLRGERLPAIYGHAVCNGAHAVFFVHAALVVTYSHWRGNGRGTVSLVGVDRRARHQIGIETVPLWRWQDGQNGYEELAPDYLRHNRAGDGVTLELPLEAIAAAKRKSRIYHCRSAVYTATGGAAGPNGARRGAGAAEGGLPWPWEGPGIGYDPA